MHNTLAIARRELSVYFYAPVAYVFVVVFLLISGYMFFTELFLASQADMRPFFGLAPLIFCFFGPLITMRLFAEEKAQGFYTNINPGTKIQSLITDANGTARVDFSNEMETTGGSCRVTEIRSEIDFTLKQFPTIKNVIISINGETETILQP